MLLGLASTARSNETTSIPTCSPSSLECNTKGPQFSGETQRCYRYQYDTIRPTTTLQRIVYTQPDAHRSAVLTETQGIPFKLHIQDDRSDGLGDFDGLDLHFNFEGTEYKLSVTNMPSLTDSTEDGEYMFMLYPEHNTQSSRHWSIDRTAITTRFAEKLYGGTDNLMKRVFEWDCKSPFPIDSADVQTLIRKYIIPQSKNVE